MLAEAPDGSPHEVAVRSGRAALCGAAKRADPHLHHRQEWSQRLPSSRKKQLTIIKNMPNHNDDGTLNTTENQRLVTGILVTGTAQNPVLYCQLQRSADRRREHRRRFESRHELWHHFSPDVERPSWVKLDLVRGLPRSEENHGTQRHCARRGDQHAVRRAWAATRTWGAVAKLLVPAGVCSVGRDSVDRFGCDRRNDLRLADARRRRPARRERFERPVRRQRR